MPETLTVQAKEVRIKEGTSAKGKPWKSRLLVDANDDFIGSTFGPELNDVQPGQTLEVEREQNGDYWNIVSVKPVANGASVTAAPTPGTGDYIKGKEAPETRAAIAAAVALKEAVRSLNEVGLESMDEAASTLILYRADFFYTWLMSKTNGAAPEKGAQSAEDVPATAGQLDEIQTWIKVLDRDFPASADPEWKWTNEAQSYVKKNFGKDLVSQSSKAQAEQVRAWLETRKMEREAEEKVAF